MTPPRVPTRKLNRWTQRCDDIENMAAELNDAANTLLATSNHLHGDAYPTNTLNNETHAEGDHADPVLLQVLNNLEPQQRDTIAEHLREIDAVTHEIRGHLRRVTRLKDIIINRKDPRTYDTGGDCKCCGRYVSGASNDRLRALYCDACYKAWTRHRAQADNRGDSPSHHEFEQSRRAHLDKEQEQAARRESA